LLSAQSDECDVRAYKRLTKRKTNDENQNENGHQGHQDAARHALEGERNALPERAEETRS
jgi:hypothetical protein